MHFFNAVIHWVSASRRATSSRASLSTGQVVQCGSGDWSAVAQSDLPSSRPLAVVAQTTTLTLLCMMTLPASSGIVNVMYINYILKSAHC